MKILLSVLVALGLAGPAAARVERVEILSRNDILEGKPFGEAGAYEKLIGKVHLAVKPEDAPNKWIVDLDKAPRNKDGEVEFASDFYILRPKETAKASGAVLLEIPNRGGKGILGIMHGGKGSRDPSTEEEFGDGFLFRRGVTVAWLGWQWDVREDANMMRLYAPVARGVGDKPITGLVRADFMVNERVDEHPLAHVISGNIGGTEYFCSDVRDPANVLTVRDAPFAQRKLIPRNDWEFVGSTAAKLEPGPRAIRLQGGFGPGKIYEVVYRARDPVVVGLGFAVVRDFASYLKRNANELAPATKRVHALGISQSGRFLRHFLLEGFNADESGKRAIDGMFIHVAGAGIGSFNHRFAQPSRDAQPTNALFYPTDLFPFTDAPQTELATGQRAGLLDRARAADVVPKTFHTNTSYEYWSRAGSLIHTSPDGKSDAPPPENARIYLLTGLQHFTPPFPPMHDNDRGLRAQHLPNALPVRWFWRALFVAMDDWVREGREPPASRYPTIADGTLVRCHELKWPRLRGIAPPQRVHEALRLDFGPQWKDRIIAKQPPGVGKPFPALVPQVNDDGNEIAGVRLPQLEVPLATYTGWNLRAPQTGMPNERVSFLGSFFPLPKTRAQAEAGVDPRPPMAERYASREDYLAKFRAAANQLAEDRFLLQEDVDPLVARGGEEWDYVTR